MSQQPPGMQTMMADPNQQDMSGNYYPSESDLTGGLPINLDSLRDGPPGSKPFYPYSTLIRYVVCGQPAVWFLALPHLDNDHFIHHIVMQSKAHQIRSCCLRISTTLLNQECVQQNSCFVKDHN